MNGGTAGRTAYSGAIVAAIFRLRVPGHGGEAGKVHGHGEGNRINGKKLAIVPSMEKEMGPTEKEMGAIKQKLATVLDMEKKMGVMSNS